MTASELLAACRQRGMTFTLVDQADHRDKIVVTPVEAVTPAIRDALTQAKPRLVELLRAENGEVSQTSHLPTRALGNLSEPAVEQQTTLDIPCGPEGAEAEPGAEVLIAALGPKDDPYAAEERDPAPPVAWHRETVAGAALWRVTVGSVPGYGPTQWDALLDCWETADNWGVPEWALKAVRFSIGRQQARVQREGEPRDADYWLSLQDKQVPFWGYCELCGAEPGEECSPSCHAAVYAAEARRGQ